MVFDITKEQFSKEVEHEAKMNKVSETPYMDESQASKLISKPILEKIQSENLNYNIIRTKKSKLLFT
jgi:hypothetical protein